MWRGLRENEKEQLLAQYKVGASVIKGFMTFWLFGGGMFVLLMITNVLAYFKQGDYIFGIVGAVGGLMFAGIFVVFPVKMMKSAFANEINALESGQAMAADGTFVSSRIVRRKKGKHTIYARVNLYDEFSNTNYVYECHYYGTNIHMLNPGDAMVVIKMNPQSEDLVCMDYTY